MTIRTIEVPAKCTDINLIQLETLSNLSTAITKSDKNLFQMLHPDTEKETDEAAAEASNVVAESVSVLTNISVREVFELNSETLNLVQGALLNLINDVYSEMQASKIKSNFFVKKKRGTAPNILKSKIEFYLASDIERHYPSFVFTKCSSIIEKIIENPSFGLSNILDLISYLAYIKPQNHRLNDLFAADLNGNQVYDMNKFNERKELIKTISARDGIRLFNFFLLKQARALVEEAIYSKSQRAQTENQAKPV